MRLEWTACRQAITLARIRAHSRLIGIFIVVGSFLSGLSGSFKKAHRDGGEPLAAPGNDPRSGEQFLDSIPRWALDLSRRRTCLDEASSAGRAMRTKLAKSEATPLRPTLDTTE